MTDSNRKHHNWSADSVSRVKTEACPAAGRRVPAALLVAVLLICGLAADVATAQVALFRVNAGGDAQTALDSGIDWDVDTAASPSTLHLSGSSATGFTGGSLDPSVPPGTPAAIFDTERWDAAGGNAMEWDFPVGAPGTYEVRLYFKNGYSGTSAPGDRVFNVLIEGVPVLTNYDIVADVGHQVGVMKSFVVTSDANLDVDFAHVTENPLVNAIEIVSVASEGYLLASTPALNFGSVEVGSPIVLPLTLENLGTSTSIVVDPFAIATDFQATFAGATLAPGASTLVLVTFDPAVGLGTTQESLAILHDGVNSPLNIGLGGFSFDPGAAPIAFNGHTLAGVTSSSPTSLQFGPDGRLYVSQQNGLIKAYDVVRNDVSGTITYAVTATEDITLVQAIPNHNDDGSDAPGVTTRQVTGLLVTGTAANPVLYVTSSDPRIAVNNDSGLDTNSGIISRLSWTGSAWDHVLMVRGLPRSEENHSTNGLDLDENAGVLYVMQGGNTNKGAPSNNFSRSPEYALSAALLAVDLTALAAMPVLIDGNGYQYVYDLPTIDDPTRSGDPDATDPFGGNNGLNQAIWDPTGPVQVYSPGYRNAFDVVLTSSGRLYTFDNGPNGGWGGLPINEGTPNVTNGANETGDTAYGDQLHFITGPGFYGGHPNPTRANPTGSGIFTYEKIAGTWTGTGSYDWTTDFAVPPVAAGQANPIEGTYLAPGADSSLFTVGASTNGICEYTASNFGGQMAGQILAASFNGNVIRFKLNGAGDTVLENANVGNLGTPLDVTAQGDFAPFPGTIWSANHGPNTITIYEPTDFGGGGGTCSGVYDLLLDEDGDGFSNADEIDNGTDPCASGSFPADADGDLVSDLNDTDDDNDGLPDTSDPFAIDPANGLATGLPVDYTFSINAGDQIPGTFFELGFTGLMSNGTTDYRDQFDPGQLAAGGAAGFFTVEDVPTGDAYQAGNSQQYAFQFGLAVDTTSPPFLVHSRLQPPFFGGVAPTNYQSFGLQLGAGDQDNYLKIVLAANGGAGGVQVLLEVAGVATQAVYGAGVTGDLLAAGTVDVYAFVDPVALTVQPRVSIDGGTILTDLGAPLAIPASWLAPADDRGLAVGIIATSFGSPATFNATWDLIEARATNVSDAAATLAVTAGGGLNASTYSGGSFQLANTSAGGQKITRAIIDLGGVMIPDMVFDPAGTAGDLTAKPFSVDSDPGVGAISHALSVPHGNGGFEVLTIDFAGSGFDPGETLGFSIDADPTSIEGVTAPGPGEAGSVSGLELVGATVTVEFDDGSSHTASLYSDGSAGGGFATMNAAVAVAPGLQMLGQSLPATVSAAAQTVRITGPAGATARLLIVEAALFEQPGGGVDLQPFEANSAVARQEITGIVLNGSGVADVPVTLTRSGVESGLNHLVAVLDGAAVLTSPALVVELDPVQPAACALARINVGGPAFSSGSGADWSADTGFSGGSTYSNATAISGTSDGALFQTERYGAFSYEIPVPDGSFDVNLLFAEIYHGVQNANGAGARVFDVFVEGALVLDDFDILAETTPATALVKTIAGVTVSDGFLSISVGAVTDSPKLSAIEVLPAAGVAQSLLVADVAALDLGTRLALVPSLPQSVVLTALGDPLDITDVQITGSDAGNFSHDASPPVALAGCDQAAIAVTFTPDGPGARAAVLEISYSGGGSPLLIDLSGTGLADDGLTVLHRINTGGPQVAAADGSSPDWSVDTAASPSPYRLGGGEGLYAGNAGSAHPGAVDISSPELPTGVPAAVFDTERYDAATAPEMSWELPVPAGTLVEVRLYFAELFSNITAPGQRVFDVMVEGVVPAEFTALDPYALGGGPKVATVVTTTILVADGGLSLEFVHGVENPALKGIEVVDLTSTVSAVDEPDDVPTRSLLVGAYPNPFNPSTTIAFRLAATGPVELGIYDLQGRLVRQLVAETLSAGSHDVVWDGRDRAGRVTGSGVYLYRLRAGDLTETRKIMLVK